MAASPTVSVVIPTFDRRVLVERAIRSALAQSRPPEEIIVVDDGSTDGTAEALERLGGRIILLRQENRGVSAARNAGIQIASNELVAFLDSDDEWKTEHLEILTSELVRQPKAVLAFTGPLRRHLRQGRTVNDRGLVDLLYPLLPSFGLLTTPSRVVVRRELLVDASGFNEHLAVAEDSDLWTRLAMRGPFVPRDHKTVERGRDERSLIDRGRRESLYIDAFVKHAEGIVEEVADHRQGDAQATAYAEGQQHLVSGLLALLRNDIAEARRGLEQAVLRVGWLSDESEVVMHRVDRLGPVEEMHRRCARAAAAWPQPASETAVSLRANALAKAMYHLDPLTALRVLTGSPLRTYHRVLGRGLVSALRRDSEQRK